MTHLTVGDALTALAWAFAAINPVMMGLAANDNSDTDRPLIFLGLGIFSSVAFGVAAYIAGTKA